MATLFSGGQAYDLNLLVINPVPGYELCDCTALNDRGQIVAQAYMPATANYRMVLLTSVPPAAGAGTIYVTRIGDDSHDGRSWATAKKTVTGGLAAAVSGDQVWVAEGTYQEGVTLRSGVALYGGFAGSESSLAERSSTAHVSILDGNASGIVVWAPVWVTAAARIDGFTIRNGKSTYGAGIDCLSSAVAIANNTITGNNADSVGAGIYCSGCSPTIIDNLIAGNTAGGGGGIYCEGGSPVISGNTITRNTGGTDGGGIYCASGSPMISDNTITNNRAWTSSNGNRKGGGISCGSQSSPTITGNTIMGNEAAYGGGIHCWGCSPFISNNRIIGNAAEEGGGILASSSSNPYASPPISNNIIQANVAARTGGGIYCGTSSQSRITNNTIVQNSSEVGGGLCCDATASPMIYSNIVAFNSSELCRLAPATGSPALYNNCVYSPNGRGYTGLNPGTADINVDPLLVAIDYGQVHLTAASPCFNAGLDTAVQPGWTDIDGQARVFGAHVDIGADEYDGTTPAYTPAVVRVSPSGDDANDGSSWALAMRTVQAGIDRACITGGDVWVAAGLYNERITLKAWVYAYGGFAGTETAPDQRDWAAHVTILDGGGGGSAVQALAGSARCGVDGFTIRNGSGTSSNGLRGGGIYCSSSSPIISHNAITGNTAASGYGGGVYCTNAAPAILNNQIVGNTTYPNGFGGGIYCASSSPIIAANTITGNASDRHGGGVYVTGGSADIRSNLITGNTAGTFGGGVYCGSGRPSLSNNTVAANVATEDGGGIYCYSESPSISNNVVAFNSSGIYKQSSATPTLRNNCVYNPGVANYTGMDPGIGDISVNPAFVAAEYGKYHLAAGSPCIDAGLDTAVQPGGTDVDGEPRIQAAHVDIGADEFNGTAPAFTPTAIRVSPTGNDANDGSNWAMAKRTVQAAIDAAAGFDGAEVWVAEGVYAERITLKAWVHVFGGLAGTEENRDQRNWASHVTILDGQAGGSVVSALAGSAVCGIDGFTIRNGTGTRVGTGIRGGGLYCLYSLAIISHNIITDNMASAGGGIYCYASRPVIANNTLSNNRASLGGGICSDDYCAPAISDNVIAGNFGSSGGGILCWSSYSASPSPTILNNTITGNSGSGIYSYGSSPMIANNIIALNLSGIYRESRGTPNLRSNCVYNPGGDNYTGVAPGTGDIAVDPQLVAVEHREIHLTASSPCIDAGSDAVVRAGSTDIDDEPRVQGARVDIGADEFNGTPPPFTPTVVYVSSSGDDANDGSSWTLAKQSVQAGVNAAAGSRGGEVWVAAGTYPERVTLKAGVLVYGGFAGIETNRDARDWSSNVTILDGGAQGSVVSAPFGSGICAVDGFVIRNGVNSGVACSSSMPRIANNTITGNTGANGGGISCATASARILDNTVVGNTATTSGGGIWCDRSSPPISNNTVLNNIAGTSGGGIYCTGSSPTISSNQIAGNSAGSGNGGGVYCGGSSPVIANNAMTRNGAGGNGGGLYCVASAAILNNVITANTATRGGGLCSESGTQTISNNSVVSNAAGSGGGIYSSITAAISNNVIAFNSSGIFRSAGTLTLRANCVYNPEGADYSGLSTGTTDRTVDPQLVAPEYGELHLKATSPCIDSGDDAATQSAWPDMDGQPRIQGPHVDIGADEFDGTTPAFVPTILRVSPSGDDANEGSNWNSAKRTVQAGIDAATVTGGQVWVAEGQYDERIVLKPWTYVYGGFAGAETGRNERNWETHPTVVDGQAAGTVVSALPGSGLCGIDGLTIRNGTGTLLNNARYGGGVYCQSALPLIANVRIVGNTAAYGAGIYCASASPKFANAVVAGNSASASGGGAYHRYSSPRLSNCTFSANSASSGAGLANFSSSSPSLVNCILWGNSGPAITNNSSTATVTYSDVQGGSAGTGNLAVNPRFVRVPGPGPDDTWATSDDDYGDLRLQIGSPCVDAGNNAGMPADTLDLDGDGNIAEPLPFDLGRRPRFVDDVYTPDIGSGAAPLVDIGAYELLWAPGDYDYDGDVDARLPGPDDLDVFQVCATGPGLSYAGAGLPADCPLGPAAATGWIAADLDHDGDVDQDDFGIFQRCYSGSGKPADANCAN